MNRACSPHWLMALLVTVLFLPGCLIVSSGSHDNDCNTGCHDYEVCETYCDAWTCWEQCDWYRSCTSTCDTPSGGCYSDLDCGDGTICINDRCQSVGSNERGASGLCQTCETRHDCVEENARCIRLNYDQTSNTGEKVCARDCNYNHECPSGFECVNVSDEPGVPSQCLPIRGTNEKRTCNSGPDLECVRASDCALGESCVNNECTGPEGAQCSGNRPCPSGQECRNFQCVPTSSPECLDRSDCQANELCIDGACISHNDSCVFNDECDTNARCVDGQCVATCESAEQCGPNERCRQGLCEAIGCRRSADCDAGHICVDAHCEKNCDSSAECGDGFVCNTYNYCVPDPTVECRSTAECARDEICVAGECTMPCSCNQQCPESQICDELTGSCRAPEPENNTPNPPAVECSNDCECPSGQSCHEGTCS